MDAKGIASPGTCPTFNYPLGEGRVEAPPTLFPSSLNLIKLHQYVTIPVLIYPGTTPGNLLSGQHSRLARVSVRTVVLGNHAVQTRVLGPNHKYPVS